MASFYTTQGKQELEIDILRPHHRKELHFSHSRFDVSFTALTTKRIFVRHHDLSIFLKTMDPLIKDLQCDHCTTVTPPSVVPVMEGGGRSNAIRNVGHLDLQLQFSFFQYAALQFCVKVLAS